MKNYIFCVILLLINGDAYSQIPEWKVYSTIPQVNSVLLKHKDESVIQNIVVIRNTNSRFLALVREFLIVQNAYAECKESNFIGVGYLSEDGKSVDSGTPPDSVKDLGLRRKYIERLAQNAENNDSVDKMMSIKRTLLKSLRETCDLMDATDKINAKTIVDELSGLKN